MRRCGVWAAQAGLRLRHVFLSGFYVPHGFTPRLCARGYGTMLLLYGALCFNRKSDALISLAWRHCFCACRTHMLPWM